MPIERFPSAAYPDKLPQHGEYTFSELRPALDFVCEERGIVQSNKGEDDQSAENYLNYSIGSSDADADAVFLVGWDRSKTNNMDAHGIARPHTLNAPRDIIDAVKARIEQNREEAKFSTAPSQT